jgi:outer membrane protein assembly factor BamB
MTRALATAGNFLGHYDGTLSAYDAKNLNEMWSFDVGSPIRRLRSAIRSMASSTLRFWWVRACGRSSSRTRPS